MWIIQLQQEYYDHNEVCCGNGPPVILESKFGETQNVLQEIKDFLEEQGDKEPLTTKPEAIDTFWNKARQDPRQDYYITLRTNTYSVPSENDEDFEGTIEIYLHVTYNIEVKETYPETSEQLSLF